MQSVNSDIFKQCQVLVYLIALCMSAVCVLDTLAPSISIIQEIGNIKSQAAENTVIIKDSNYSYHKINKQSKSRQYHKQPPKSRLFQVTV